MKQKDQDLQISLDEQNDSRFQDGQTHPKQTSKSIMRIKNDESEIIVGLCQQFISKKQLHARQLNFYQIATSQHPDWQPMACHFRNIQYISKNVRTPETLENCLNFVCKQYLPYYKNIFKNQVNRKRFELFLYDRVRAIRCQLYVQGIFNPKISMKLVKLILFLETSIGQPITLTGLEQFLRPEIQQKISSDETLKKYYQQALQYSILSQKRERLAFILDNHSETICSNARLMQCLSKKLKILNNNYYVFLIELIKNTNVFSRLILWSQMKVMREVIVQHYCKAKMNQKASFITKILGYQKMDGWINISKPEDYEKLSKHKQQFDLEIKLWISQGTLMQGLEGINSEI